MAPSGAANVRVQKIERLVRLCEALTHLGVRNIGMSDARPALSLREGLTGRRLWVEVDAATGSYVWRRDDRDDHPADDPAGAAARLVAYLTKRNADPGGRP